MKISTTITSILLLLCSSDLIAGSSTFTWDFGNNNTNVYNNKITAEKYGVNLELSAWSSSWHGGQQECQMGRDPSGSIIDKCIERTDITKYSSGIGNINGDESGHAPQHALDNTDFDYDMIMLQFSEEVSIDHVYTGYNETYKTTYTRHGKRVTNMNNTGNAGIAVMTYQERNTPAPFSNSDSWEDILNNGWGMTDNHARANTTAVLSSGNTFSTNVNVNKQYSKYWLIGAAYYGYGYQGNISDYVKLAGIKIDKGNYKNPDVVNVNSPSTLLLFGFAGIALLKRRNKS